jgi:hypothetical protein
VKASFTPPDALVERERRRYDDTEIIVLGIAPTNAA